MNTNAANDASEAAGKRHSLLRLPRLLLRGSLCIVVLMIVGSHGDAVHPMLDLLSNFQLQYFLASLVLAGMLLVVGSRRCSAVAALCAIAPAMLLAPWYLPRSLPDDVLQRPVLRVMQFNVLEGNTNHDAVIAETRRHELDVVVFQEVDQNWREGLEQLADVLPYVIFQRAGSLRGNLVRSRYPLFNVIGEPSIGKENAPSFSATLQVGKQQVSLLVGHTVPPHDVQFSGERNRELIRLAQRACELPKPLVFLGDLNTGMWSPHYKAFERESGLVNARRGFGVVNTFPMDSYAALRVPLDHCLVSRDVAVVHFQRGNASGSDHAPIIAELALPLPAP